MTEIVQGSPEWFAARLGRVTASRIGDVLAKTKTGWGSSRYSYMGELIAERMTGRPNESFTTTAMQWGKDNEDRARSAYEFRHDKSVKQVGFVDHPRLVGFAGASPDGLVDDGLIEIKCPSTITHLETITSGKIPTRYQLQMQWQLECYDGERNWCDFISFDPRLPENLQLFVTRYHKGDLLEPEITKFIDEMKQKVQILENYRG